MFAFVCTKCCKSGHVLYPQQLLQALSIMMYVMGILNAQSKTQFSGTRFDVMKLILECSVDSDKGTLLSNVDTLAKYYE